MTRRSPEHLGRSVACPLPAGGERGIPGCGTGPVGRIGFVLHELADIVHSIRHRPNRHITDRPTRGDNKQGNHR